MAEIISSNIRRRLLRADKNTYNLNIQKTKAHYIEHVERKVNTLLMPWRVILSKIYEFIKDHKLVLEKLIIGKNNIFI